MRAMRMTRFGAVALSWACLAWASLFVERAATWGAERPNVLFILADDLGYSDLGCYGGEIATPRLDELARHGVRFTQFYNTARCWPSRGALLTGYYAQHVRRDSIPGKGGGSQGTRPAWAPLLPELLRPLGYRSYHSGKWHVDGMPLAGGFERSYYLRDEGRYFRPKTLFIDDAKAPGIDPDSPGNYYSTTAVAEHATQCLADHVRRHPGEPFFQYIAFTAPHFPLQAPEEDIERYRNRYRAGWETLRRERHERQRQMDLNPGPLSEVERDVGPPYDFPDAIKKLGPGETNRPLPWDELTDEQREFQATKMAIHAAMVDRMDREIGRVVDQLRALGLLENTIIFFASDNGASAEIMVRDDGHDPAASPGSAATHLCLGPGWSSVANTPFRRHKTWVHEGGISTPLIVHWPAGLNGKNALRRQPSHLIDIVPTVLELAGGEKPAMWKETPVPAAPGRSLLPAILRDEPLDRSHLWWLHEENRAVRVGDWKLVAAKGQPWSLYNLAVDRAETRDLAQTEPERVKELERVWQQELERATALR